MDVVVIQATSAQNNLISHFTMITFWLYELEQKCLRIILKLHLGFHSK